MKKDIVSFLSETEFCFGHLVNNFVADPHGKLALPFAVHWREKLVRQVLVLTAGASCSLKSQHIGRVPCCARA